MCKINQQQQNLRHHHCTLPEYMKIIYSDNVWVNIVADLKPKCTKPPRNNIRASHPNPRRNTFSSEVW